MPRRNVGLLAFNRGRVSRLGLARTDIERMAMSAETMTNWMPRVLGSMMLRPGWKYLGATRSNLAAKFIPFVFSTDDTALVELTDRAMRVWVSDALISRPSVSTAVTNGSFDTDLSSWTDNDESGGTSAWVTGGYMGLTGNGTNAAIRDQQVTVAAGDQNVEHALTIVIERGPVVCSIGSTAGGGEYFDEASLETGTHSLSFTPTGNFHVRFQSRLKRQSLVDSCTVAASGVMSVTTPWLAADLDKIRFDQSGDVIYVACEGYQQRKIERRSARSWGCPRYAPENGPLLVENTGPITITPSALSGNITLTASKRLFRSNHVGGLFRITSEGQTVEADVTAENQFTNTIRITGTGTNRAFTVVRAGTWTATVTLQRSITSETGPWVDATTYTNNGTVSFNDALDNQIVWYRIGVKTGDFTSGTAELELRYNLGAVDGIARITAYTSGTSVSAEVITDLGGTSATDNWAEGEWSTYRGFPSSVALHQGRLWWSGKDGVWGSVSDNYESYGEDVEGDSGTIARTIGSGPVDTINWILPGQRLLLGAEGSELSCISNSLDEPLTPTNFNIKAASTQGSANVAAVKVDNSGVYVQRGGTRVFELLFDDGRFDYNSIDLTQFIPEMGQPRITRMAVQRQPDTRIHCIRSDGTVALALLDRIEEVLCWCDIDTDGDIEDVVVLPGAAGDEEDQVYYVVARSINGSTVRYLEKWANEDECRGAASSRLADSFLLYSGAATTTITGLTHLEGETVVVWGSTNGTTGSDLGTKVVSGGQITGLSESVTSAVVGLSYTAQWKSAKLALASPFGSGLTQTKRIPSIGVILADTHHDGLQWGPSFSELDDLSQTLNGAAIASGTIHTAFDQEPVLFPGEWNTDSRLCLQAVAPRACTILAAAVQVESKER